MKRKCALITGAGTGIGQGIAMTLGRAGYDVAVHYHSSRQGAEEVCRVVEAAGGRAIAIQADLSDLAQIRRLFQEAEAFLGRLDLYVNNSGITKKSLFEETSEAMFDELIAVDLKSAYFCVQQAGNTMARAGTRGCIVVIASNNGLMERPEVSVYGTIKTALIKMTRHAAVEYAKYGIRVNSIAPGWTATPRTKACDEQSTYPTIPLKRWCQPEEIGGMVLFYASEAAASVTGNCLVADGGAILLADQASLYGL